MRSAFRGRLILLSALVMLLAPATVMAQVEEPDTVYELVLTDGSSFVGRVEQSDPERVVFRTLSGVRLEVDRSQIRRLEPTGGRVVDGEVWNPDPNRTRLFFGPTARALDSGEGYVGLFELFFAFGAFGVGDRLVLAGGTPVVPGLIGDALYVAPKARLARIGKLDLAAGALAIFLTEEIDEGSIGIVYGVGTYGDTDDALTLGAGWGFALGGGDASLSSDPVLMIGGERRASRRVKLITENYLIVNPDVLLLGSAGVRFLGERFSADLGLGAVVGDEDVGCCIPVLSAAYTF